MHRAEVEKLLARSGKFSDAADFHFSRGDYDLAVFNIEQALQLFLKAVLLKNGVDFPKTHTLRRLFILLGEFLAKQEIFREFMSRNVLEFSNLEDAYVSSRYFPREFSREEASKLRSFLEEVKEFIRQNTD
ncbi:MAG: HEPN domain-containing protein [Nitrososphaerota archaeon]